MSSHITSDVTISGDLTVTGDTTLTGAHTHTGLLSAPSGIAVGSGGTTITKIKKGTVAVTVSALNAAAEEDIDVTVSGAGVTDVILVTPLEATMETGLGVLGAWCATAGTVSIRVTNASGSQLTGSTSNWNYVLIQS